MERFSVFMEKIGVFYAKKTAKKGMIFSRVEIDFSFFVLLVYLPENASSVSAIAMVFCKI